MITCQPESFEEKLEELQRLLPLHYRELALDQDKVPLSPRYDIYIANEHADQLLFMVMRDNDELIGYYIGFISPGLHYSTCLSCTTDIFYIHPDKRKGSAGVRLFRAVEAELRRRSVDRWFMGSKMHADASALFKRIGAQPIEVYYSKWIGQYDHQDNEAMKQYLALDAKDEE